MESRVRGRASLVGAVREMAITPTYQLTVDLGWNQRRWTPSPRGSTLKVELEDASVAHRGAGQAPTTETLYPTDP